MKTIVAKILIVVSLTGTQVLGYPQERLTPGMRAINLFSFFSSLLFFLSLHPWKRNLTFDIFNLK